ncbi:tetratricopeptide repeat protein [Gemmatimonas sp.]
MNRPATPAHPPAGGSTFAERLHVMRLELAQACQRHAQSALTADERDHLKQEIIVLFREADAALQQAMSWKEAVKGLAEQWKQLDGRAAGALATSGAAANPAPARVDHLGASTFIEKGWSKLSLMDAAGAEAAFRRALDLAPGTSEAESLLAWAQMAQGQFEGALSTLHAVLQRDPHHALAHVNLGYICLRRQKYGEAIEHLSTVVRADGDRRAVLYAHLYLGMVYREREMYEDAETFLRKALELGPNLLQAWYELGRAYWFAGRRGDARLAWKTGSEANKFSPWGKRCAEILETVEQGGAPPRHD